VWRQSIADAVQRASGASFVAVYSCPANDPFWSVGAAAGPSASSAVEPTHSRFVAFWERLEGGTDAARALGAHAHAPLLDTPYRELGPELRTKVFTPRTIRGLVNSFIVTNDGALVGWIALGTRHSERAALEHHGAALRETARAAGNTVSCALDLARACGARLSVTPPAGLSVREEQVATMVATGLSDANVAARLSLSEETVGAHLRRVFRKLGVHSRTELAARLWAPAHGEALTRSWDPHGCVPRASIRG
jgi:DNA-binding CsgD family transcriptional regulator